MLRTAKKLTKRFSFNNKEGASDDTEEKGSKRYSISSAEEDDSNNKHLQTPLNSAATQSSEGSSTSDELTVDDSSSTKSEDKDNVAKSSLFNNKNLRPFLTKCHTAPSPNNMYDSPENDLEKRLDMIDTGNLELMLCMETRARMDNQEKKEKEQRLKREAAAAAAATPRRPTKIKFELPVTPPRSRSPILAYPKARPVRSLPDEGLTDNALRHRPPSPKPRRASWRYLFGDRDSDDDMPLPITLGSRVRLTMRPLPTFGYVKFIGAVEFGHGEWIGIELDHGVGNSDGSVDGVRYFDTDSNRGIFCKRRELEAVAE